MKERLAFAAVTVVFLIGGLIFLQPAFSAGYQPDSAGVEAASPAAPQPPVSPVSAGSPLGAASGSSAAGSSQLEIINKEGKVTGFVPLRHTAVKTEISGFVARTELSQEFENVLSNAVEAIYVFPLPHESAVDGMTMTVGDREIQAVIKEREEARKIFEQARNTGHTAALLDQERPNIFTQSVTNIPPGGKVVIKLYVLEMLKYEAGTYEFAFPLVVGPRYIPGAASLGAGSGDHGTMANTDQVRDASRISPPVAGVHTGDAHAGHDVSIDVSLAAGVPIADVASTSHKIFVDRTGPDSFHVQLADAAVLPDKDFILRYKAAGLGISDAVLSHSDKNGGYFTLILQPPEKVKDDSVVPRQLIFVLDTSGSMWGFPIEMAKKTIQRALDNLRKDETFNLITFSGDTRILFPEPVPATPENVAQAKKVLAGAYGSGGTEMMKAIRTALGDDAGAGKPMEADPVRVVCFMTDGYVGNDAEIVAEVKKHSDARVFAFGIGTAVNRFLLSKMSEEGNGEVEFVTNATEAEAAADRFYERVHSPVLVDISIDWNGLPVTDVYPKQVRDLFSAKPIIITGRFTQPAAGNIVIKGNQARGEFRRTVPVDFSTVHANHAALEKIWARNKVEELMAEDWSGIQQGNSKYKAEIIKVGLEHSLATQYTSFVAVEERTVIQDGKPVRVEVPVELPQGVSPLAVPGGLGEVGKKDALGRYFYSRQLGNSAGGVVAFQSLAPGAVSETVAVNGAAPRIDVAKAKAIDGEIRKAHDAGGRGDKPDVLKEEDRKLLESKLTPDLMAVYRCSVLHQATAVGSACKPVAGTVRVKIALTATNASITQKLVAAGFKAESGSGTVELTGNILPAKLKQLAEIAEVKSVQLAKGQTN
jgi:Ca-activated chloride channel homolog